MRAMWGNAEGEDAHASNKSVERLAVTQGRKEGRKKKEGKVKEKPSEEGQSIHQGGDDDKVYLTY